MKILILFFLFLGCGYVVEVQEQTKADQEIQVVTKLSWEKDAITRAMWSQTIREVIDDEWKRSFSAASDGKRLCFNYYDMPTDKQKQVVAELIVAMAKYESGWDPKKRLKEPVSDFPNGDAITGKPVYSEGLLQLSYQDVKWHPYCNAIDWTKDKNKLATDHTRTILSPTINLNCGAQILARQIRTRGTFYTTTNYYWSVLRIGGKWGKTNEITSYIKKAVPSCR